MSKKNINKNLIEDFIHDLINHLNEMKNKGMDKTIVIDMNIPKKLKKLKLGKLSDINLVITVKKIFHFEQYNFTGYDRTLKSSKLEDIWENINSLISFIVSNNKKLYEENKHLNESNFLEKEIVKINCLVAKVYQETIYNFIDLDMNEEKHFAEMNKILRNIKEINDFNYYLLKNIPELEIELSNQTYEIRNVSNRITKMLGSDIKGYNGSMRMLMSKYFKEENKDLLEDKKEWKEELKKFRNKKLNTKKIVKEVEQQFKTFGENYIEYIEGNKEVDIKKLKKMDDLFIIDSLYSSAEIEENKELKKEVIKIIMTDYWLRNNCEEFFKRYLLEDKSFFPLIEFIGKKQEGQKIGMYAQIHEGLLSLEIMKEIIKKDESFFTKYTNYSIFSEIFFNNMKNIEYQKNIVKELGVNINVYSNKEIMNGEYLSFINKDSIAIEIVDHSENIDILENILELIVNREIQESVEMCMGMGSHRQLFSMIGARTNNTVSVKDEYELSKESIKIAQSIIRKTRLENKIEEDIVVEKKNNRKKI